MDDEVKHQGLVASKGINAKFTRKNYYKPPVEDPPQDLEKTILENEKFDENIIKSIKFSRTNTQKPADEDIKTLASLQHIGKWIPKQFDSSGKQLPWTGLWSCCGLTKLGSVLCSSFEDRDEFAQKMKEEEVRRVKAEQYADFVKKFRREPWEQETNDRKEFSSSSQGITSANGRVANVPVMIRSDVNIDGESDQEDGDEEALRIYNAPMLISWIYKNIHDDFTVRNGLQLILENIASGEGCKTIMQFDGLPCVLRAISQFKKDAEVQLLGCSVLRRLLDCNHTRDALIQDEEVLRVLFSVGHAFMHSAEHVVQAVAGIMQCARSEVCRVHIFRMNVVNYSLVFCRKYWRVVGVVRPILKLFNWITTNHERMCSVCAAGAVRTTLKAMERHLTRTEVLSPALHFLTRAAADYAPATEYLLKKNAVPIVIGAMKALYASERLQLEGLKMLQALSRHEEGWRQISETSGGWQSITQGVGAGDALLHELPGAFHNPGWTIGDTPHLPELERKKLIAAQQLAQSSLAQRTVEWTSNSLKVFMGQGLKDQKLAINIEFHETYFELLNSLELLPTPGEERDDWLKRLNLYESENSITLEDMVNTVLDMRKREIKEKAIAAKKAEEGEDYVKPLYVRGKRVTTKGMDEADRGVGEELEGIV